MIVEGETTFISTCSDETVHCIACAMQYNGFTLFFLFLQVGARSLETAVWGAFYNVKINLKDITDETFSRKVGKLN